MGLWILRIALVLALFAVWTLVRVENRRLRATTEHPPEGRFTLVDGHPVHYVQIGSGPDLVLIHGASGSTRDWTFDLAPKLAERYRVTIFDRPGLGYTPALADNHVTLDQQTDLLVAAARGLEVENPIVVGQSFGGAVLMNWAVRHPDFIAGAVDLAGATHTWPGGRDLFYRLLAQPVLGPVMAHLVAAWVPHGYVRAQIANVFAPNEMPEGYADYIGPGMVLLPETFTANAQQRHQLYDILPAQMARYPGVEVPVEILHGEADTIVGVNIHSVPLSNEVQDATLTTLPGVGHMPQHAAQDAVIAAIDRAALRAGVK